MSKKNRGPEIIPLNPWTEALMDLKDTRSSHRFVDFSPLARVIEERNVARIFHQRGILNDEQLRVFEEGVTQAVLISQRYSEPFVIEDLIKEAADPYRMIIAQLRVDFYGKHKRTP